MNLVLLGMVGLASKAGMRGCDVCDVCAYGSLKSKEWSGLVKIGLCRLVA